MGMPTETLPTTKTYPYGSEEYKLLHLLISLPPGEKLNKSIIDELHCGRLYADLLSHELIKEYDTPTSFAPTEKFYQMSKDKKFGFYLDFEK
jgi:hypothetical protein